MPEDTHTARRDSRPIENQSTTYQAQNVSVPSTSKHTPNNLLVQNEAILPRKRYRDGLQSAMPERNISVSYDGAFTSDVVSFLNGLTRSGSYFTLMPTWIKEWIIGLLQRWNLAWGYIRDRMGTLSSSHRETAPRERPSLELSGENPSGPPAFPDITESNPADTSLENPASLLSVTDDMAELSGRDPSHVPDWAPDSRYSNGMYTKNSRI